jgi:hypothetical protein
MLRMFTKLSRVRKILILLFAACAVTIGGALYAVSNFDPCETVVHNSISSPDGSKSIVVFEKECGATVGFNTQASIAPAIFV